MTIQGCVKPWIFKGFDVGAAVERYHKYYDMLCENEDKILGYDLLVTAGDCYLNAFKEEAGAMCKEMQDVISSDREAAAFALALNSLGMDAMIKFNESEVA